MTAVLRGHLARELDLCSPDETRVIARVMDRLKRRRDKHGSLDLARSPDVFAELNEGLIDAVIACTVMTLRAEDLRHEQARRGMLGPEDEARELAHWQANDQRTVVSNESHRIALEDIAEHAPRPLDESDWDMSEFGGGEGG